MTFLSGQPKMSFFLMLFLSHNGDLPNFGQKFYIFIEHVLFKTKMLASSAKNFEKIQNFNKKGNILVSNAKFELRRTYLS